MPSYAIEIIIAIISMLGTASGAYFANKKTTALVAYRLEQLEKKQDVHNQVIDRVYKLEKSVALNSEDIKVANHRIQDLERKRMIIMFKNCVFKVKCRYAEVVEIRRNQGC